MPDGAPQVSPQRIMEMAWGFAPTLVLEAGVRHRVFDVLDAGPKTVAQVAAEAGLAERGARILLDALVGLALLEREGEAYRIGAEASTFLVTTKPSFQGGMLRHTSTQLIPKWLTLSEVVQTGHPSAAVNQQSGGAEFFRDFVEDIFAMSYPAARSLAGTLGLAEAKEPVSVLDLATGSGVWGIALAQASPQVRVTAVDWPEVLPVTQRVAERMGVGDRFTYVSGDIQTADFGSGHQVATLGHIIHSEGEKRSRALLAKTFAALASGGTIAIGEMIPNDDRTGPAFPLLFAVNMLVNTEVGDTFTFAEMSAWLREAGFTEPRLVDAPSISPLLLATKP
jgi:hypothetical protein